MTNLYKSEEWKTLNPLARAQLLLVIEGLKRGAIIYGNWTTFIDILKQTGLDHNLYFQKNRHNLKPMFRVAKPEYLRESVNKYLTLPEQIVGDEFHKITGWLLGYPECCIGEYVKKMTSQQSKAQEKGLKHLTYKFGEELTAKIKADKTYPDIFDYRPPSFTPCGINCPEATKLLTSWKDAIDTLDPEASKELIYSNRDGLPAKLAHREYLQKEKQRRGLEYRIEQIRRSIE